MRLPDEVEMILAVIGQIDEQYQKDDDLGIEDVIKIVLIPLQDRIGIDIGGLFEWLSLTRELFGDVTGTSILDKRFKELERSVNK